MTDIDTKYIRDLIDKDCGVNATPASEGEVLIRRVLTNTLLGCAHALLDAADERDTLRIDRDAYRASADQARIERDRLKAANERLLAALDAIEQLHRAVLEGEP